MYKLGLWISRLPALVMLAILAVTGLSLLALTDWENRTLKFSIDPSIDGLLPDNTPLKQQTKQDNFVFGVSDAVVISARIKADVKPKASVFDPNYLQLIEQITESASQLPRVKQVDSLATAPSALPDEFGIDSSTISEQARRLPERIADIQAFTEQSALYHGHLISEDERASLIVLNFMRLSDEEWTSLNINQQLQQLLEPYQAQLDFAITGTPVIKAATAAEVLQDLSFTIPVVLGLMALILLAAFRSIRGMLLPLLTILIALIWTIGGMQILGIPLNLITVIVPPLVMTVGLAYAMHVLTDYYNARYEHADAGLSNKLLIPEVMQKVGQPVLLAGLTTAAGFMALTFSPLPAIDQFAWASVLGIGSSVILALTFMPAAIRMFGCPVKRTAGAKIFSRIADLLTRLILRRRNSIIAIGIGVIVLSLIGAGKIEVGSDYIRDFPADHPVRQDFAAINQAYNGANGFSIVLDGYIDDSFVQPKNLQAVKNLQRWLNQQPEIGGTLSLVDHLELLHATLAGSHILPSDANTSKQLLVLAGGNSLRGIVDNQFRTTRIIVSSRVDNSRKVSQLLERIERRLSALPKPLTAHISGDNVLITQTVDEIASGQLLSISIALLAVLIVLALLFTSIRTGLITLLPNILPVAVYFGALGWMGIQLSPTTSLIACIVLGIAVDDTIHYLARFNQEARESASERGGTYLALKGVLRPVTYTTIALVTGFLVLTTSELQNQVRFGALAAFTLFIAWISDITFTPALASKLRIVTLWDVLRLDLGKKPQQTIKLFHGLKPRQARIFALLSKVLKPEQGEQIITLGDTSDGSMYVIIDGEFEVWIPDDHEPNGRKILNRITRGGTLGEVGYFTHKRSANVTAVTSGRVLRFTENNLDKLRRRFPFIAATVFRNLNNIQAERLARITHNQ